jgi:hypothetical protein
LVSAGGGVNSFISAGRSRRLCDKKSRRRRRLDADATLTQLQTRTGIQNQVNSTYTSDFTDAGVPLTPQQASGLVQAMADANYAGKDTSTCPAGYNIPNPTTGLTPHDNRIINSAAAVLSPAQVQVLTTDQIENHQIAAIMKQYNKSGGPVLFVP